MHNKSFRGKEGGVHATPPKKKERKKISEGNLAQVKTLERRFDAGEEKKDWSKAWRDGEIT